MCSRCDGEGVVGCLSCDGLEEEDCSLCGGGGVISCPECDGEDDEFAFPERKQHWP